MKHQPFAGALAASFGIPLSLPVSTMIWDHLQYCIGRFCYVLILLLESCFLEQSPRWSSVKLCLHTSLGIEHSLLEYPLSVHACDVFLIER